MSNKSLLLTIGLALAIFVMLVFYQVSPKSVMLTAHPWNDGAVHIWHTLVEAEATFSDVPAGTRCQRLDNKTHRLVGAPPPIFYYHVNCGGVIGYVEVDQVR